MNGWIEYLVDLHCDDKLTYDEFNNLYRLVMIEMTGTRVDLELR